LATHTTALRRVEGRGLRQDASDVRRAFATILLERGIYFFTHDQLGFSTPANLALALAFGLCYAAGALGAHPLTHKLGERRLFALLTAALIGAHAAIGLSPA